MTLPSNRTLGVVSQGATTDRTGFSHRVRWLPDPSRPQPRGLLALMPDEARLREARRLLSRYPGPVYLALEEHASNASAEDRVWRLARTSAVLSLEDALGNLRPGGRLPSEPLLTRRSPPGPIVVPEDPDRIPDYLLPAVLKPAAKGVGPSVRLALDNPRRPGGAAGAFRVPCIGRVPTSGQAWTGLPRFSGWPPAAGVEPPGTGATGPTGPGLRVQGTTAVVRGTR